MCVIFMAGQRDAGCGETKAYREGTQTFLIHADNKLELNEMISERHQSWR